MPPPLPKRLPPSTLGPCSACAVGPSYCSSCQRFISPGPISILGVVLGKAIALSGAAAAARVKPASPRAGTDRQLRPLWQMIGDPCGEGGRRDSRVPRKGDAGRIAPDEQRAGERKVPIRETTGWAFFQIFKAEWGELKQAIKPIGWPLSCCRVRVELPASISLRGI